MVNPGLTLTLSLDRQKVSGKNWKLFRFKLLDSGSRIDTIIEPSDPPHTPHGHNGKRESDEMGLMFIYFVWNQNTFPKTFHMHLTVSFSGKSLKTLDKSHFIRSESAVNTGFRDLS